MGQRYIAGQAPALVEMVQEYARHLLSAPLMQQQRDSERVLWHKCSADLNRLCFSCCRQLIVAHSIVHSLPISERRTLWGLMAEQNPLHPPID